MIALVARYRVLEGRADEVAELLLRLRPLVLGESGCHAFSVHRADGDPHRILLYEQYEDEVALAAHRATAHFRELVEGRIVPLLAEREREVYRLLA